MTNLLQMRMKMSVFRRLLWIALVMLVLMPQANAAQARTIVDMTGRTVEIPDVVNKIFGASPPTLYLLYAMAPETIAGWNFPIRDNEKKHLRKDMLDLPVIGGWFGQGRTPNIEHVMAVKPDFMLVWYMKDTAASQLVEQTAETMHLPIVYVRLETLEDYARTFRFLGDLLGRQERGNELADYTERVLAEVAPIVNGVPEQDRIPVYYAEYLDGLKTECDKSPHAVLIEMAGGRNVNECESKSAYGMESISIEEVINKQPQVIVAQETEFLKNSVRCAAMESRSGCEEQACLRYSARTFQLVRQAAVVHAHSGAAVARLHFVSQTISQGYDGGHPRFLSVVSANGTD